MTNKRRRAQKARRARNLAEQEWLQCPSCPESSILRRKLGKYPRCWCGQQWVPQQEGNDGARAFQPSGGLTVQELTNRNAAAGQEQGEHGDQVQDDHGDHVSSSYSSQASWTPSEETKSGPIARKRKSPVQGRRGAASLVNRPLSASNRAEPTEERKDAVQALTRSNRVRAWQRIRSNERIEEMQQKQEQEPEVHCAGVINIGFAQMVGDEEEMPEIHNSKATTIGLAVDLKEVEYF